MLHHPWIGQVVETLPELCQPPRRVLTAVLARNSAERGFALNAATPAYALQ
jgi:hypothetical protein